MRLREILTAAFAPTHLTIRDDSSLHRSHRESSKHGGGHYAVTIVSARFHGMQRLARHRAVYRALRREMHQVIHALQITAYTPEEWQTLIPE